MSDKGRDALLNVESNNINSREEKPTEDWNQEQMTESTLFGINLATKGDELYY